MRNNYRLLRIKLKGKKEDTSMNYEVLAKKGNSTIVLISGCSESAALKTVAKALTNDYFKDRTFSVEPIPAGTIPVTKHSLLKK